MTEYVDLGKYGTVRQTYFSYEKDGSPVAFVQEHYGNEIEIPLHGKQLKQAFAVYSKQFDSQEGNSLEDILMEAKQEIEYFREKYLETGSENDVISRIDNELSKLRS